MTETDYLRGILEPILDEPDKLSIAKTIDDMGVLLSVQCGKNDMGRIIGRQGATAKAIRTLMRIFGMLQSARINVKLLEPEGSSFRKRGELDDALSDFTSSKTITGTI